MSYALSREKRRKVSVSFSSSLLLSFFLKKKILKIFYKCFLLAGMTTKFNQDMYVKMRSKKNEPLSDLGKRTVCIVGKGPLVTPAVLDTRTTRIASPATSVEEIATPISKKPRLVDKGKEKADSLPSSVWDDARLMVERPNCRHGRGQHHQGKGQDLE